MYVNRYFLFWRLLSWSDPFLVQKTTTNRSKNNNNNTNQKNIIATTTTINIMSLPEELYN
jgi:hypothetical protein